MADAGVRTIDSSIICKNELCSSCGACVNICPRGCIKFKQDRYGQERPIIDEKQCVGCNLCRKTCPNNRLPEELKKKASQVVYAGWRENSDERRTSSSGGVASAISEYMIQNGGVVYGVVQKQENILYQRADTIEMIRKFRGSKYVQADSTGIYEQIQKDIADKKKVLVIGVPCLIAGILSYMDRKDAKRDYQKYLFTIDLLCHGIVPQNYLKEHIAEISRKHSIKFDEITFRSNIPGENYRFILKEDKKMVYSRKAESDSYFYSFLSSISTRESCVDCIYKDTERCGDITLGDFLGLGREMPFPVDRTGIHPSLIMVNSDAGKQILENIKTEVRLFSRTLEEAVKGGPSLRKEDRSNDRIWRKRRKRFRMFYPVMGFEKAARKSVGDQLVLSLTKEKIKRILKR